jgi:GNAT superfamily N-acetyltransferase
VQEETLDNALRIVDLETALATEPSLFDHFVAWQVEHYADSFPSYTRDEWVEFYNDPLQRGEALLPHVLVGFDGSDIAGTVAITQSDDLVDADHFTPWIAGAIVAPSKRGRGRGAYLIAAAEAHARNAGVERLYLWTHDRSAWYLRLGWAVEEHREFRGVGITIMSKAL